MREPILRILVGWVAGFLATLTAHQLVIAGLHAAGVIPAAAWRMTPVAPFGVPAVISLAFWGGVWGSVLALLVPRFPRGTAFWVVVAIFGALGPPLVAWFIVAPLKGMPIAGGFNPLFMVLSFVINAIWALAAAAMLRAGRYA